MELESRGSASVDKLSWPHCIKVIFSQMRKSGKIQKTGIKLGKRSGADCSGIEDQLRFESGRYLGAAINFH